MRMHKVKVTVDVDVRGMDEAISSELGAQFAALALFYAVVVPLADSDDSCPACGGEGEIWEEIAAGDLEPRACLLCEETGKHNAYRLR